MFRAHKTAKQLRDHEIDEVVRLYGELGNVGAVARQMGVSRGTIGKHLASRGIETVRRMTPDQVAQARELYEAGQPSTVIAKLVGFDNKTVIKELRGAGVQIRAALGR